MATTATKRKILAVLAGGLVLGIGTAATLAAWNDSEFATGTFTAGAFNLQGSTTSATTGYSDHNTDTGGTAASLVFSLPATASSMAPGDTVYAPFWVRLDSATTNNASLSAAGVTAGTGGNEANMVYTIRAIGPTATCDITALGTIVATGTSLSTQTGVTPVVLSKGATAGTAGTAVQLCIAVTAGTVSPGAAATATWKFTATSVLN